MFSHAHGLKLKKFVREKAAHLIDKLEKQMADTHAAAADEESVHHLRTSIRRLSECLRTFQDVLHSQKARRVRRKLRVLMDLAAEVRNRDIAEVLFRKAGVAPEDGLATRLEAEKLLARASLVAKLDSWQERKRPDHWRALI